MNCFPSEPGRSQVIKIYIQFIDFPTAWIQNSDQLVFRLFPAHAKSFGFHHGQDLIRLHLARMSVPLTQVAAKKSVEETAV